MDFNIQIGQGGLVEFLPFAVDLKRLRKAKDRKEQENIAAKQLKPLHDKLGGLLDRRMFCPYYDKLKDNYARYCKAHTNEINPVGYDEQHCLCRETARNFPKGDMYAYITHYLGTTWFKFQQHAVRLQVWVDLYPTRNIGILCFAMPLDDLSIDDVIALKAYFTKPNEIDPNNKEQSADAQKHFALSSDKSIAELTNGEPLLYLGKHIAGTVAGSFGATDNRNTKSKIRKGGKRTPIIYNFGLLQAKRFENAAIEIKSFSGVNLDNIEEFVQQYAMPIYGLLTDDEGYRYVPQALTKKRLQQYVWQTRTFKYIVAYGKDVVMLNAKNTSAIGKAYIAHQEEIIKRYHEDIRDYYFHMSPCVACIDHCVFDAIEKDICVQFEARYVRKFDLKNKQKASRRLLLDFIYYVAPTQIEEINELYELISRATGTARMSRSIKVRLPILQSDIGIDKLSGQEVSLMILTFLSALAGGLAIGKTPAAFSGWWSCIAWGCAWFILIIASFLLIRYISHLLNR